MVGLQEWEEDERSKRRRLIGIIDVRRSSTTGKIAQRKESWTLQCKQKEEKYSPVKQSRNQGSH